MVVTYQRLVAVFGLLLGGATWRLWIPQQDFPQVPLFRFALTVHPVVDWALLVAAAIALVGLFAFTLPGRLQTTCGLLFVGAVAVSIVLNQHRCQPWAYQFMLIAMVVALAPAARSLALLRMFATSIYVYSAIGKFDYQFLHTVGPQLTRSLVGHVGIETKDWPFNLQLILAASLPAIELSIALGLIFERTRRIAVHCAASMHALLILVLGPTGLNHHWGVLLWNAFFICQAYVLFAGPESWVAAYQRIDRPIPAVKFGEWIARIVVSLAISLPVGERLGWFDHWPAWALYAPHSSRVNVEVARTAVPLLPSKLRKLVPDADAESLWVELPLGQWSLESLAVPIYPQARFQMGVAEFLSTHVGEFEIRVTELSSSSRWTGERSSRTFDGATAIRAAADRYWLNAHPRVQTSEAPRAWQRPD